MYRLTELPFDNSYARLPELLFQRIAPTPLRGNPRLIAANPAAAALLNLDPAELHSPEFIAYCNGEQPWAGSEPLAMLYAGHQFGFYVPQLGDGRAILLGETRNPNGEKWDIQVKGSGLTAFSRDGDGRAVLRSTIREYLASEAMHGLGVPTTRALAIIGSDEPVAREQWEAAALLVRLSPSHVRFGTFEVLRSRRQYGALKVLADYVIAQHYPELKKQADPYLALLQTVVHSTAQLMARWHIFGFVHGVMNTDNMSILGLTLDYGPYAFLDAYLPCAIFNHTDHEGRYTFAQQPTIGKWNLTCLARAFLPLLHTDIKSAAPLADTVLAEYDAVFKDTFYAGMRARLGLQTEQADDEALIDELLNTLSTEFIDYTLFMRQLCYVKQAESDIDAGLAALVDNPQVLQDWLQQYRTRLAAENSDDVTRQAQMLRSNPKYILRTHLAQQAIEQAQRGEYQMLEHLLTVLHAPFDEHPQFEQFAKAPEKGVEVVLSCSS